MMFLHQEMTMLTRPQFLPLTLSPTKYVTPNKLIIQLTKSNMRNFSKFSEKFFFLILLDNKKFSLFSLRLYREEVLKQSSFFCRIIHIIFIEFRHDQTNLDISDELSLRFESFKQVLTIFFDQLISAINFRFRNS